MTKETINTIYTWEVEQFRENISSPIFTMTNDSETSLTLELEKSFCVSLYIDFLKMSENFKKNPHVNVKLSIKNCDSVKVISRRISFIVENLRDDYGFSDFTSLSEFESFMNHKNAKKILIICKIEHTTQVSSKLYFPEYTPYFGGFNAFLNEEKLSDVTLCLGEKKLRAHKVILAAASPVFAKMFDHKCKENFTNEVNIDFNFDAFFNVLKYIYTGEVKYSNNLIMECFKIADYYQLESLLTIYKQFLENNLEKLNNVIQVLKIADDCQMCDLKKCCVAFFVEHSKTLIQNDDLKALTHSHPHLLYELLASVID